MIPTRGGITIACWTNCDAWSSRSSIGRRRRRQAAGMPARRERRPKVENSQRPVAARRRNRDKCHWRMATRLGLGVADDNKIRFLGGGVEPIASMFDQRSPRLQKQEGQYKKSKEAATPQSLTGRQGKGWMLLVADLCQDKSVVVKSRQGFSGGLFTFHSSQRQRSRQIEAKIRSTPDTSSNPHSLSKEFPQVLRPSPVAPERPSTKSREPTKFSRQPSLLITTAPSSTTTPKTEAAHQTHPRLPTFPTK